MSAHLSPADLIRAKLAEVREEVKRDEEEMAVRLQRHAGEMQKLGAELTRGREAIAKYESWLARFDTPNQR